jgi:glycosyltransferase involved in cell wall biosynthesis
MHHIGPPKVSVCVITYNQEKYISKCLQSIIEQETNFKYEVIVGDDCSTDETRKIINEFHEKYPDIIKPIYQEKNINSGAYNYLTVHQAAKGEYVAHIDGDDYALSGKLQMQVDMLDSDRDINIVWHRVDYFDDTNNFISGNTSDLSILEDGYVSFDLAARIGFIGVHSSIMYRRNAREIISLNRKVLDIYLVWDMLSKGKGYFLNEVLGRYRVGASGSLTIISSKNNALLAIEHAEYFVRLHPNQRKNYFIWALTTAIINLKNRKSTSLNFILFCLKHISLVNPVEIFKNINMMNKIKVKWAVGNIKR